MASTLIDVPQGVWTQITTADKAGSIKHISGDLVVYLESDSAPTGFDENTPRMEDTHKGDGFPYFGVAVAEFVFAYSVNGDAVLSVTPAEVA